MPLKKHSENSKLIACIFRWNIGLISIFLIPLVLDFLMLVIVLVDRRVYFDQFQGLLSQLLLTYLVPLSAIFSGYIAASIFVNFTSVSYALMPDIYISFIWNVIILLPFLALMCQLIYIEDLTAYINSPIVSISQSILNLALVHFFVKGNEMAAEIQQLDELLKRLSQTYPTNTTDEQMVVATEAIKQIESDPNWKQRVLNAAKEGGLAAFEKALDNPIGALITGAIKGWLEAKAE